MVTSLFLGFLLAALPISTQVIKLEPLTVEESFAARVVATNKAQVRAQITGIILERLFQEGCDVELGQPLYKIDEATFVSLKQQALAGLIRAEALIDAAGKKEARYQTLLRKQAVSQQDYDDALAALKLAQAEHAVAQAQLDLASLNLSRCTITAPLSGRIGASLASIGDLVSPTTPLSEITQLKPIYVDISVPTPSLGH